MRPLRLQLKGFTAYRDEQVLDFEGLDLFAIVGPTGSGKSYLLDAMTYALFGQVERVGTRVGQLVSQGQKRMAVTFDFAVGDRRFRIARSTPVKGASRVLLERWEGEAWTQAGEGADRVRDVNAAIEREIGLGYQAFTRAVLLPQGRFAEFLVGDAKSRRSILTELLGLELFERLAKRAGEIRTEVTATVRAKTDSLAREYEGVTPEAVAQAEADAAAAAAREAAVTAAGNEIRELTKRGAAAAAEIRDLQSCATEAGSIASLARGVAEELEGLAERTAAAGEALALAIEAATLAATGRDGGVAERERAEETWGVATELVARRERARGLTAEAARLDAADRELATLAARPAALEKALAGAEAKVVKAAASLEKAAAAETAAGDAVEEARHADVVAAVRAGVHAGDACPVCGAPVATLPAGPKAGRLDAATARLDEAARRRGAAEAARRDAERARDRASAELDAAAADLESRTADVGGRRAELSLALRELSEALGASGAESGTGLDAEGVIELLDERIATLQQLAAVEREAVAAADRTERERVAAERDHDRLQGHVNEQRAALAARPASGVLERARTLLGEQAGVPAPPDELPSVGPDLAGAAATLATSMDDVARSLEDLAARRSAEAGELVERAGAALAPILEDPDDLPATIEQTEAFLAGAVRRAAAGVATAERDAQQLAARLAASVVLTDEVRELDARAGRFAALASELRADRVMEFLQTEALQVLAASGSEHLERLSEGRYRLETSSDEFFVVDTWNGEERRSARTLSGGESFLASLALALGLAEQVQALAVTEKAPLESLFLDEGFGTLDPETLEVVVGAIEQLGGDGRIIGVITHVQELAIRLPMRVEVVKSPRGSRFAVLR